MKILYLADIRFPLERANGVQTIETCHALARRRHAVTLLVRPDTTQPAREPLGFYGLEPHPDLTIEYVRARAGGPRSAYVSTALHRALGRSRPDVVFTRDLGVAAALMRVPRRLRPPVVYESHGYAPLVRSELPQMLTAARAPSDLKRRVLENRERRVWCTAEGYVTITAALAAEMTERFGPRGVAATIPDGVRLTATRAFAELTHRARPIVTYAGHLYPWKGVDILLRALALSPELGGSIVGGHPGESDLGRLSELASSLGLDDRVQFVGLVEPRSVPAILAEADVLVLPNTKTAISDKYTSPLKLFEYMAAGKPIVASDLCAIREVLHEGRNAILVPPGEPEALAHALRMVVADRALARRLANQAFLDASQYGWDQRAERLEHVLMQAGRV